MNLNFGKKEKLILAGSLLLTLFVYLAFYLFYIKPLNQELERKEKALISEKQIVEGLEKKSKNTKRSIVRGIGEMQSRLPVAPLMDQLVLDIEEAEIISGSEIGSIEFGTEESRKQDSKEDVGNENSQEAEGELQAGETVKKPKGVETDSITVTVAASNYFELKSFIETLEGLQRVITVDSIDFNGPEEITSWNKDAGKIEFTLTLSVFYMPSLNDLKDGLSSLEIPEPSNKKNPFYTFGSVLQNGQE